MLVGLIGRKRHGKDTLADFLIENYNFEKYSFATPLKLGAIEMFGLTHEQVYGDDKEKIDPLWECTPREILQVLGTELLQFDIQKYLPSFKKIGRLIWVKNFTRYYQNHPNTNITIADVRFIHEANHIKDLGGVVIKVIRPGMPDNDMHPSETEIDKVTPDYTIINDGNLQDLYNKMNIILLNINGKL